MTQAPVVGGVVEKDWVTADSPGRRLAGGVHSQHLHKHATSDDVATEAKKLMIMMIGLRPPIANPDSDGPAGYSV